MFVKDTQFSDSARSC